MFDKDRIEAREKLDRLRFWTSFGALGGILGAVFGGGLLAGGYATKSTLACWAAFTLGSAVVGVASFVARRRYEPALQSRILWGPVVEMNSDTHGPKSL